MKKLFGPAPGRLKIILTVTGILLVLLLVLFTRANVEHVTYMPSSESCRALKIDDSSGDLVLENSYYKMIVDKGGTIYFKSADNKNIVHCLNYYAEYENTKPAVLTDVTLWSDNDTTVFIEGNVNKIADIRIIVSVRNDDPEVSFTVRTSYKDSATVIREAMVAFCDVPVNEVYLKNRQMEVERFKREYWLDKEGVKLGEDSRSFMIYNPPGISSLQLDTEGRMVVINLENQLDHPFITIPFQKDGRGKWSNSSAAKYISGDERTDSFSVLVGKVPKIVPRLMLLPNGYLAGYVFTEHADSGSIQTHRAAYFGSETITDISHATGGFAAHRIPVTKSIFYEEFDEGISSSSGSSKLGESEYLSFLDQLYSSGLYDLCLHTPENTNSERNYLEEAILFMKERYDAATWIDHGMYQGNTNRESFVADGLNPSSGYYAADLWSKYGTRYFWSPAVEAIRFSKPGISVRDELMHLRLSSLVTEFRKRYKYRKIYFAENSFAAILKLLQGHFPMFELNSFQPMESTALPTPLYWQNPTISGSFYSWTTEYVYNGLAVENADKWISTEKRGLDRLVNDQGIFINHGYYIRNSKKNRVLTYVDGKQVVSPEFDEILAYMDSLRNNGDLWLTTIKEIVDYWVLKESISFKYINDGTIEISNNNDKAIKGLSLAVRAKRENLKLDGEDFLSKEAGDDTVLWFDVPANGKRILRIH